MALLARAKLWRAIIGAFAGSVMQLCMTRALMRVPSGMWGRTTPPGLREAQEAVWINS